jgi:hypothetical protein
VPTVETKTQGKFLGTSYSVRSPIYRPNQQKLEIHYQGIAFDTTDTQAEKPQVVKPSPFISKLITQLGF